jgi:pimeloyl-ACP methyl ester carboxylesterase
MPGIGTSGLMSGDWKRSESPSQDRRQPRQSSTLQGGFSHYKASHAGRIAMIKGETPALPPITTPTCVRWPEHDALLPYSWTDRLKESFADLDLAPFPDVGHFPHREDPDRAAREIDEFFSRHDCH